MVFHGNRAGCDADHAYAVRRQLDGQLQGEGDDPLLLPTGPTARIRGMSDWSVLQWFLLAAGAFVTGLSKTGIAGLGILAVALFANAMPARESTGALLPLLVLADLFGIAIFRKHGDWRHVWRLFPWVAGGVVLGYATMGCAGETPIRRLIGGILLAMVGLHLWRQRAMARDPDGFAARLPHTAAFAGFTGILAGFTTMVANAAGPVMVLYLLARGLPKLAFLGTMAWFFFLVNLFKLPFSWHLGLIGLPSLILDAKLALALLPGVALGPVLVGRLNQKTFEWMVLALTGVAAVRLVL
jgi:uncharacterized membrane protein YfcA